MFYLHWGRICRLHTSLRLLRIKTSRFDWTAIQMWHVCNLIPNSSFCFAIVHAPIHRWTVGGGIYFYFTLLIKTKNNKVLFGNYKECSFKENNIYLRIMLMFCTAVRNYCLYRCLWLVECADVNLMTFILGANPDIAGWIRNRNI